MRVFQAQCLILLVLLCASAAPADANTQGASADIRKFLERVSSLLDPSHAANTDKTAISVSSETGSPPQAELQKASPMRGSSCPGKITNVWCKETHDGFLQDLAYYNSVTGLANAGCDEPGWLDDPTSGLYLKEDESIIEVQACKMRRYGYTSVTFITDAGQTFTCGQAADGYEDDNEDEYSARVSATPALKSLANATTIALENTEDDDSGDDIARDDSDGYVAYGSSKRHRRHRKTFQESYRKRDHRERGQLGDSDEYEYRQGRNLLVMSDDADMYQIDEFRSDAGISSSAGRKEGAEPVAEIAGYYTLPKHKSKCQSFTAPKKPRWSSKQDWYKMKEDAQTYGMVGEDSDAYFEYKNTRYYKDHSKYEAQLALFKDQPRSSGAATPAFYYSEVSPLAGFKMQCDRRDHPHALNGFCWDSHYKPKPCPKGVKVTTNIILNAFDNQGRPIQCPRTPAEVQKLNEDLATISSNLNQASGGIIQEIVWQPYSPAACEMNSNATISLSGTIIPGPGYTNTDVVDWLATYADEDLCTVQLSHNSICIDTEFYVIPFVTSIGSGGSSSTAAAGNSARRLLLLADTAPNVEQDSGNVNGAEGRDI